MAMNERWVKLNMHRLSLERLEEYIALGQPFRPANVVGSELRVERETVEVGTIGTTSQVNLPGEVVENLGAAPLVELPGAIGEMACLPVVYGGRTSQRNR